MLVLNNFKMETPTFQEYKNRRVQLHEQRMLRTTARDQALAQHPYEKFIPHHLFHFGMRQAPDLLELKVGWNFLTGFIIAFPASRLRYGMSTTPQRILKTGFQIATISALAGPLHIWAACLFA